MDSILGIISALVGGVGLLASSPIGPAALPDADMSELSTRAQPAYIATIADQAGNTLGTAFRDGPLRSPLELFPEKFLMAVIAIEDRRFFEHRGIDPIGLGSAALSQFGSAPRGGSSIDQQMAKNAWLGPEISLRRKIPEAMLALRARRALGPGGVMRAYLETAWFGRGVTGAAGAAQAWFGRPWDELNLSEMAYLAGLLKGPGFYDAERHPERALQRRDQVLRAMVRADYITQKEADAAMAEPLVPSARVPRAQGAGSRWMMTAARANITRAIDQSLSAETLVSQADVTLTLDPVWQDLAQTALTAAVSRLSPPTSLAQLEDASVAEIRNAQGEVFRLRQMANTYLAERLPWDSPARSAVLLSREGDDWVFLLDGGEIERAPIAPVNGLTFSEGQIHAVIRREGQWHVSAPAQMEGAIVILDPRDGALIASVGGAFPDLSAFDRTRALRQPGSSIKTFLWLAALEQGFHPGALVPDIEQDYVTEDGTLWRPRNYGRSQSGLVSFAQAYEASSNLVAAYLVNSIGAASMGRMAERAGAYPNGMRPHMTAALGTMELTLADLTRAHGAVVNAGAPREIIVVDQMQINERQIISNGLAVQMGRAGPGPIASRNSIEEMLGMMRGVITRGTASQAFRNHPVSVVGKTGTTQNYRDAWFFAVTPHIAIGVWLGRDDNQPMSGGISGGRTAAPIAASILRQAHEMGLIDSSGFRDDIRSAAVSWPVGATERISTHDPRPAPAPSGQSGMVFEMAPSSAGPSGMRDPMRSDHLSEDPFWGVTGNQRRLPDPPAASRFQPDNRNEDLRRNRWE